MATTGLGQAGAAGQADQTWVTALDARRMTGTLESAAEMPWRSSASRSGVVAIGGGGGVSRRSGDVYFLSPERLDGASEGVDGAPNLYIRAQPGSTPQFVATLESSASNPLKAGAHVLQGSFWLLLQPRGRGDRCWHGRFLRL